MFNYTTEIINRYKKKEETCDESSSTPASTLEGERHISGLKILTEEEEEEECYGNGGGEEYGDCDYDDNDNDDEDDDNNNNSSNNNSCDLYVC